MKSIFKGDFQGVITQVDGNTTEVILKDILYVPDLWVNLFSLTKPLENPQVTMYSVKGVIALNLHGQSIFFDKQIKNGTGKLLGIDIVPVTQTHDVTHNLTPEIANINKEVLSYKAYHNMLGHPHQKIVKATAERFNVEISDEPSICVDCAKAKQRQTNIPKKNLKPTTEIGQQVNIDISSVKARSFSKSKYWLLIQDDFTGYLWSYFLKERSDLPEQVLKWVYEFQKELDCKVQTIRLDNAGENESLQELIDSTDDLKIKFEYTAPYTPQQNGKVERKYATLYGKVRAMLNAARLTRRLKNGLWTHCAKLATQLENVIVKPTDNKTAAERLYGNNPNWINNLHIFGEVAMIAYRRNIKAKLVNRGYPSLFMGYSDNHAEGVFIFFKLSTEEIIMSRDVIWLNQHYKEYMQETGRRMTGIILPVQGTIGEREQNNQSTFELQTDDNDILGEDISDESDAEYEDYSESDSELAHKKQKISRMTLRSSDKKKLPREVLNLRSYFNPEPGEYANVSIQNIETNLNVLINDGDDIPKTYAEAQKSESWSEWKKAAYTEFKNMETKKVWKIVEKSQVPAGRKIIANRWVFARKDDGRYRARTVAKGFSQIPGKDFSENFAPVVNDATFRIVLTLKELFELSSEQFDVETAFLYGDLDEDLWMELPEGYQEYLREEHQYEVNPKSYCVKLQKAIYGLVQAARQWWKKFTKALQKLCYEPSKVDPCLFINTKNKNKPSYIILYVDDGGIFGTEDEILRVLTELKKEFVIKSLGKLEHFVGCHIIENKQSKNETKKGLKIHQPKLLNNLKKHFGKLVSKVRSYKTPAAPKTVIMRPKPGDPIISEEDQTKFRSGVGMLLYLVKHSRPDINNAVRELAKVADGATEAHWANLLRTIKFVLDTENFALFLNPVLAQDGFTMEGLSDSEYAGDRDTRISVYGYLIYFCGALIAWKSKSGRSVTLSSTEAEYYATSEVAKEIIFAKQVIESMGLRLSYPIIIKCDNVGAIYLSNNYTTGQRTKHIDVRCHFVREYIEDGILKVIFVPSSENEADILTKNTSEEIHHKHAMKNIVILNNN
jgi:Reverse transcriptase (RNA-dependent DNA polymerase)